jgi:hypothetical protein
MPPCSALLIFPTRGSSPLQAPQPIFTLWRVEGSPASLCKFFQPTDQTAELGLKRRTRLIRIFPNVDSLMRVIIARLSELSDDWETGKVYLTMNPKSQLLAA